MDPVFEAFHQVLSALHKAAKRSFAGLGPEQLDWRPGDAMNSLAVLAAHIAGAERFWLGDIVMGEPTGRDREQEFATREASEGSLSAMLDSGLELAARAFAGLAVERLSELRVSPRDGREFSVAWSIGHVLQHTALHLGHMELTRQLLADGRA